MAEPDFMVLLQGEFATMASSWTEYLCLALDSESIHLSSCGREVLAELSDYAVEDEDGNVEYQLPETIGDSVVSGTDGEFVIGEALVPQVDDAEIELERGQIEEAREWLEGREWHLKPGFEEAWTEIQRVLGGNES